MIALINHQGLRMMTGFSAQTPTLPIGLAYIAGALKERHHEYCVIDACGEALNQISSSSLRPDVFLQGLSNEDVVKRIPTHTDIVGLTCLFSNLWPVVRELARAIKARFPNVLIVLGGEHGTALPEHALATGYIDAVVLGEGEETFLRLIEAYRSRRDGAHPFTGLQGVAFMDSGRYCNNGLSARTRTIDDIPWPDWDSFPVESYIAYKQNSGVDLGRSLPILGTRGCPFQCSFCTSPEMWTTRWISRDPVKLVDEMDYFKGKYNLDSFAFMDLTFVVNRRTIKRFATELINRNLGVVYQLPSGTRSEGFDDEVAELLYKSGLRYFAFAPESGSEKVRKAIKKKVDLDDMFAAIRSCLKQPLFVACYTVIGFPEDDTSTIKETLTMIRKLAVVGVHDVAVNKFTPYPGSAQFRKLLADGRIALNDKYFLSPLDTFSNVSKSFCDSISDRRLYHWMLWMYVNFYVISFCLRPWRVVMSVVKFFSTGIQDTKYMKVFADKVFVRRRWQRLQKSSN